MERTLLFKGDVYFETYDPKGLDLAAERTVVLPQEFLPYSTRGISFIKLGFEPDSHIQAKECIAFIEEALLRVIEGSLYLNGKRIKAGEYELVEGDRLFVDDFELLYRRNYLAIAGQATCLLNEQFVASEFPEDFPEYTRSPRIIKREPNETVELAAPPSKGEKKKGAILKLILPPLGMMMITVLMSVFIRGGAMMFIAVGGTLVSLVVSITNYVDTKKEEKKKEADRAEAYENYLLGQRKSLHNLAKRFSESKTYHNPTIAEIEQMIATYSNRIYERQANDADFLTVSLGHANGSPSYSLKAKLDEFGSNKDPLYFEMIDVYKNFKSIKQMPVVINLKNAHLGIVGEKEYIQQQIKAIIAQLAFLQSYHDIEIILLTEGSQRPTYDWARWYPHLKVKSINVSSLISNDNQRDQVLGSITQMLKLRKQARDESKRDNLYLPHFVFIIDSPKSIINHSIMEYLQSPVADLGFSLVYATNILSNLPENIKTIMTLESDNQGTLLMNEGMLVKQQLETHDTANIDFEGMARGLAPLIHKQSTTNQIPDSITFFELYGVKHPHELPIRQLWEKNASYKSLAVPLGARGKDDIVSLNLHEKAHGPHGLVAGTTGSGKSETIQSYILSLAVNFHPHEVGFLLIDYKGGGMANLFKDLPHLLGTITNLDGSESMRALASIKSELKRRQQVFSEHDLNNINEYTKLFRANKVKEPMPHLFIISDEFAELKKEQPDFMKELVSAARIGRSLGVHLILATQKPSGVVDDQIWSNSKFKLALKVQNESDSNEVLKTPDAARITQTGRAILQVGNNEIYEMFQSAWSGANYSEEETNQAFDGRVYLLNSLGQGELLNEDLSTTSGPEEIAITQLDVTIEEIKKVYESTGAVQVERPWLPPLEPDIESPQIKDAKVIDVGRLSTLDTNASIGVVDIPEKQKQIEYCHDFIKDGNLAVFGASGFGRSTVLTQLMLSLALKNSPELLQYYILDLGNSSLIQLKDLPHTADYLSFDDSIKLQKLWKLLIEEISLRKKLFARESAINFKMYNSRAKEKLPVMVLFIDNYDVIKEMGVETEEIITKLTRDGVGVGVYTVITATVANSVRFTVRNNFKTKICNYMFDVSEIHAVVGRSNYILPEIKGRAMVKLKEVYVMQEYLPASIEQEENYTSIIRGLIDDISAKCSALKPASIPVLPDVLPLKILLDTKPKRNTDIVIGLDSETIEPRYLSDSVEKLLIMGGPQSGKTTMLKVIIEQINDAELLIADSRNGDLQDYTKRKKVTYMADTQGAEGFVARLKELGEERAELYVQKGNGLRQREFYESLPPAAIIIDDVDSMIANCAQTGGLESALEKALVTGVKLYAASLGSKLKNMDAVSKIVRGAHHGVVKGHPGEQSVFSGFMVPRSFKPQADIGFLTTPSGIVKVMTPLV